MHTKTNCSDCDDGYPILCYHCGGTMHCEAGTTICRCGRNDMKTTVVLQIKPPYDADIENALRIMAEVALASFGAGGRPESNQINNILGYGNTSGHNGYVRVLIDEHYAAALEAMGETEVARLIKTEPHGQDRVQVGVDEDGEPIIEEQLFQTGEQDITDEQGAVIGTRPVYLGRIS